MEWDYIFYNTVMHAYNLHLYMDASPAVGFVGFYNGRWFTAKWPRKVARDCLATSCKLYAIIAAAIPRGHEKYCRPILNRSSNAASIMLFICGPTLHSFTHNYLVFQTTSRNGIPEHLIQIMSRCSSQAYHGSIPSDFKDLQTAQYTCIIEFCA